MKKIITTAAVVMLSLTAMSQKVYPITGTVSMLQPTCNGHTNGEITVTPNGGLAPFTYVWSNGETTQTISNLNAGNYSVLVTDAVGQTLGGVFTLPEPVAITVEGLTTNTSMGASNGAIDVTNVNGAIGNYTWEWSSNNGMDLDQTMLDQSNIKAGSYKVTITDENGCQGVSEFVINNVIIPFTNPGFVLPGVSNNPSEVMINQNENSATPSKTVLDLSGKAVDLEKSPSGFYLIVENGIVIQKIYKN